MAQAQWQEMFSAIVGNGVISGQLNSYVVTTTSGLGISVASGKATIQGFYARSDAAVPLTCATADPTNPRIDRAVLHADLTAHTLTVQLLTGTPAPSPSPPALTQTATVWEISLYQVRVNANQTTLTGGSLTDERPFAGLVNRGGDTMTGTLTVPELDYGAGVGGGFFSKFTFVPAASLTDIWTPQSGGAEQDIDFIIWAAGGPSISVLNLGTANPAAALTNIANNGGFSKLAGQALAGSFGVGGIVAQALDVNVTSTTGVTVLSYTPSVTGHYRVSVYCLIQNATSSVDLECDYFDDHFGAAVTVNLGGQVNAAPGYGRLTGVATPSGHPLAVSTTVFKARASNAMTIFFQDSSGTPNDWISAFVERLS